MRYTALIGLGSNLHSPINQLTSAIHTISGHKCIQLIKQSSFYQSLPQGPQDQDLFINAVIVVETTLKPKELLLALQEIESKQGKVKLRHWGERCIDLDILFIDQLTLRLKSPDLIVPHPHALNRDFVLIPTLEIAPEWLLPDKSPLKNYLSACLKHDLKVLTLDTKSP